MFNIDIQPSPCTSAAPARVVETALRGTALASTTNSAEEIMLPNYTHFMASENPHNSNQNTPEEKHLETQLQIAL